MLPTTANGHVTFSEKTDRADLHRYVELRESYDWETISDTHAAVMFMSDDHEKEAYDGLVRGPACAAQTAEGSGTRHRTGRLDHVRGPTAQVFFSRQLVPLNAGSETAGSDVLDCDGRIRARGRSGKAGSAGSQPGRFSAARATRSRATGRGAGRVPSQAGAGVGHGGSGRRSMTGRNLPPMPAMAAIGVAALSAAWPALSARNAAELRLRPAYPVRDLRSGPGLSGGDHAGACGDDPVRAR